MGPSVHSEVGRLHSSVPSGTRAPMARRSPSVHPPQMPIVAPCTSAQSRHGAWTGQTEQIRFAWATACSAGSATPSEKNSSGLVPRQAARERHPAWLLISGTLRVLVSVAAGHDAAVDVPNCAGDPAGLLREQERDG